jgi:hypothetical protein
MACEGLRVGPHRPQVFDGLPFGDGGPLAFQGRYLAAMVS